MTDAERAKEDDELQMVLALSLEETKAQKHQEELAETSSIEPAHSQPSGDAAAKLSNNSNNPFTSNSQQGTTAASVPRVRALYDLNATDPSELSFRRGDVITVLESVYHDWWRGSLRGEVGIFPLNYVTPIRDPTSEELMQEVQDEATVFSESRNIERLLALLNNADASNTVDDEELQVLFSCSHNNLAYWRKLLIIFLESLPILCCHSSEACKTD